MEVLSLPWHKDLFWPNTTMFQVLLVSGYFSEIWNIFYLTHTRCPKKNSALACCYSRANALFFWGHLVVSSCLRQPTTQWNQNQIIEILSGLSQFGFKWIQKQKETIPWYISENNKDQRSKAPLLQQKKPCDKKENCTKMLQAGKFTSSTCRKQNLYNRTSLHFSITQRYWYKEGREGGPSLIHLLTISEPEPELGAGSL